MVLTFASAYAFSLLQRTSPRLSLDYDEMETYTDYTVARLTGHRSANVNTLHCHVVGPDNHGNHGNLTSHDHRIGNRSFGPVGQPREHYLGSTTAKETIS